jgi:hypothetical protein
VIIPRLFFCCDSFSADQRSNTISAFHIMENLTVAALPVVIPRVTVIAVLSREEDDPPTPDFQLEVRLGDQQLVAHPFNVNFANYLTTKAVAELNAIVVQTPGQLSFVLRQAGEEKAYWPVTITQLGQQPVAWVFPPPIIPATQQ